MRLRSATKQKERHQKKVQFNQSAKKVVTNDSIGTFSPGLYILYFLKLPAPPRADLSGTGILEVCLHENTKTPLLKLLKFTDLAKMYGS